MPSHRSDLVLYLGVLVVAAALVVAAVQASSAAVTVPIAFALGVLVAVVLYRVVRPVRSDARPTAVPADHATPTAAHLVTAPPTASRPADAWTAPGTPPPAEAVEAAPPDEPPSDQATRPTEHPVEDAPSDLTLDEPASQEPASDEPAPHAEEAFSLETADVLARLEDAVREVEPLTTAVALWLFDPASATYRLVGAKGVLCPPSVPLDAAEGVVGEAGASESPALGPEVVIRDTEGNRPVWRFAWSLDVGEARGVVSVDVVTPEPPDPLALETASRSHTPALSGSLALRIARDETRIVRSLLDVGRELSRSLREERLLDTALDHAMEMSSAETGSILLADGADRLRIAASRGLADTIVEDTVVSKGEGIAGWVFAMEEPLLVEDMPSRNVNRGRRDVRSAVSVPLKDEDGVLGVLNVGSQAYPARLTRSHVDALEVIGRQTAVALRNARAVSESRDLYFETLGTLAEAIERNDPDARGGTRRTLELARQLARAMGMSSDEARAVEIAALFHDLGMSVVGDEEASDRPLSTVERGIVTMHPVIAAQLLDEAPSLREVAPIVRHHHERYDGAGYVGGLSGDGIPLGARVLAVADAYVAMTSPRPYLDELTPAEAVAVLRENAGTQFDPEVVEVFVRSVQTSGGSTETAPSGA